LLERATPTLGDFIWPSMQEEEVARRHKANCDFWMSSVQEAELDIGYG